MDIIIDDIVNSKPRSRKTRKYIDDKGDKWTCYLRISVCVKSGSSKSSTKGSSKGSTKSEKKG